MDYALEPNGTTCTDGNPSTNYDQCRKGNCVGAFPLDPFKCYRAKDLKNPRFQKVVIPNLTDEFVNENNAEVRKPFLHCNPSDTGGGINNANDHLVCYKTKRAKLSPKKHIEASDVFGTLQLEVSTAGMLCVPSSKTIIP